MKDRGNSKYSFEKWGNSYEARLNDKVDND